MNIYLNGKKLRLKPSQSIGKGGEADVFKINSTEAVKVFKSPDHPDYTGMDQEQQAARDRIQQHQTKLRQFPNNLPKTVITPNNLVTNQKGDTVLGYTMPLLQGATPLLKHSERRFRSTSGINNTTVVQIFQNLHETVLKLHRAGVIIGDFNDLNILVTQNTAYLIDADSYQFGGFPCQVFTTRFVDPLLCDTTATQPILNQHHNSDSDWYAFTVMLMQSLLFVNPYGGVYSPKNSQDRIPHTARPLKRISIFNPEVKYPKPAIPYKSLSDELLHCFYQRFEKDRRGEFPRHLLETLQWNSCKNCGLEYTCKTCPKCHTSQITTITHPQAIIVRGKVTATPIFATQGVILCAKEQQGKLAWLYYNQGEFKREDNTTVLTGDLDVNLHFALFGNATLVGKKGQVITLNSNSFDNNNLAVDSYRDKPIITCNTFSRYWVYNGQLLRDGKLGQEYIGDVLPGQTQIWVGSNFGFGFYHAGNLKVGFVFDAKHSGINDQVKLHQFSGKLLNANCTFSSHYCWFFTTTEVQGKIINTAAVISDSGEVIATEKVEAQEDSWLKNIHGNCAVNNFLLVATDEGISRLEIQNNQILKTKAFPNTEPFVDSSSSLFATGEGLYIVKHKEILKLQIS